MVRIGVIALSLIATTSWSYAQQSKVTFKTVPENATLIVNGEEMGVADERTIRIGFNERKGITEHQVVVRAPGYDDAELSFDQTTPGRKVSIVKLERSLPSFDLESDILVDFDKVYSSIPYSTNVGSNTKWKYKYDQEVTLGNRRDRILSALDRMDLPTPRTTEGQPTEPRLLVKGRVNKLEVRRGREVDSYSPYSNYYTIFTTIAWEFYDQEKKEVVITEERSSVYEFSTNGITEAFYDAVVENFTFMFSIDAALAKEIEAYDHTLMAEAKARAEAERQAMLERQQALLDSIAAEESAEEIGAEIAVDSAQTTRVPKVTSSFKRPRAMDIRDPLALEMLTKRAVVTITQGGKTAEGGGTVISTDGFIVSSFLDSTTGDIMVQFSNGILLPAVVVSSSEQHDLSLLKVEADGLYAIAVADDLSQVRKDDQVITWEAAAVRSLDADASHGKLIGRRDKEGVQRMLTNIPADRFSPGSALIDAKGRVIGVMISTADSAAIGNVGIATDARYLYHVFGINYE